MNIVLPTTSGAASCPATMPVENVQETPRLTDVLRVDLVEAAEPGRRVVLRRHDPLPVVVLKHGGIACDGAADGTRRIRSRGVESLSLAGKDGDSRHSGQRQRQTLGNAASPSLSAECKRASDALWRERAFGRVSARTKVIRRAMFLDASLTTGSDAGYAQ